MSDWPELFEAELIRLGLQPGRARQLREETTSQAAEHAGTPSDVFGPAHLYARHLVAELPAPRTVPGRTRLEAGPVLLRLTGVGKRYRRHTVFAGVSLTVRGGDVAAIVGANSCGKSTLLRICAGLTRPTWGIVRRTTRIGFVPQDGGTAGWLTAEEPCSGRPPEPVLYTARPPKYSMNSLTIITGWSKARSRPTAPRADAGASPGTPKRSRSTG